MPSDCDCPKRIEDDSMPEPFRIFKEGLERIWRGSDLTLGGKKSDVATLQGVAYDYLLRGLAAYDFYTKDPDAILTKEEQDLIIGAIPLQSLSTPTPTAPRVPEGERCEHGILWSMECLSCGPSDFVAAQQQAPRVCVVGCVDYPNPHDGPCRKAKVPF